MVRIFTAQIVDVQCHLRMVDKTMKKFRKEVDVELADPGALERHVHDQTGATRQIDHHA